MPFELPPLPYDYAALEPTIDEATMKLHHDKHHPAYVTNLNGAVEKHPDLQKKSPEELIRNLNSLPEDIRGVVRNNGGGHVNHTMFWQIMGPHKGGAPSGAIADAINKAFGSFDSFKEKFEAAGANQFGSGWAWLVLDGGKLKITSLHDADTPLVHDGMQPLFTLDVWEHAYYIDYRNERPSFAGAVLKNIVNWDFVAQNLDGQGAGRADQEGSEAKTAELTA